MSSLADLEQLEPLPRGSDDRGPDEDDWTDAGGGMQKDDSESVTSDPNIPAKIPTSVDRPDYSEIATLDTPEPIKQLLRDIAAMFDTSSNSLRRGVDQTYTILQMDTKGKFMKKGKEIYMKRVLVFYKHIAKMEKDSGRCNVPGTAASTTLCDLLHQLAEFRWIGKLQQAALGPHPGPPLVLLRHIWLGICDMVDTAVRGVQEKINVSSPGFPESSEALHLGFFLRTLRDSHTVQRTLKRKRDEGLDQDASTPPIRSDSAPFHERHQANGVLKELSFSSLAFETVEELRHWERRAYDRFTSMHQAWTTDPYDIRTSLSYLVDVLTTFAVVLYQLNVYDCAEHFWVLIVATVRETYESNPSDANRIRLCSALGAYTTIAQNAEERDDFLVVRAVEEAIALLQPLCMDDSLKHMPLMTALKISYSSALANLAPRDLNAQSQLCLYHRGIRVASQAIDLARSTVKMDTTNLQSKNMLAYALKVKSDVCGTLRESFNELRERHATARRGGPDDLVLLANEYIDTGYVLEKMADETLGSLDVAAAALENSIEVYRELAKKAKVPFEPILAQTIHRAAKIYHSHLKPKPELCVTKFKEAIGMLIPLAQAFITSTHHFNDLAYMASFDLALRLRWEMRLDEADLVFEDMLKFRRQYDGVEPPRLFWRGWSLEGSIFHARALACVRAERYDQALVHAERSYDIFRAKHGPYSGALAEPLAIQGFCKWVMNEENAKEALWDLKESLKDTATNGADYRKTRHLRNIQVNEYKLCLALGWLGGVQCALGQRVNARINGEEAVAIMRVLLNDTSGMLQAERLVEPVDYVLPHLLVLLAGTHWEAGRHSEAKEAVEESLQLREKCLRSNEEAEKSQGMRADEPTRKTALLLRAMMLENEGSEKEAKAMRDEAEGIQCQGFLNVLGCFSAKRLASKAAKA
ncbi:hypothetical protein CF327_g6000 [Tilletia walkeri]|nr:hypothetical protein CF327_g6000 [Tilletia walkeri]